MIRIAMTQNKKEARVNKTFVYATDSKISLGVFSFILNKKKWKKNHENAQHAKWSINRLN